MDNDKSPLLLSLGLLVYSEVCAKHCVAETITKPKRRRGDDIVPVIVMIAMSKVKDFNGIEDDLLDDLEPIAEACICNQATHRSQARQVAERWLATAKKLEEEKATKASQQPEREHTNEEECKYAADECKGAVDEYEYSDDEGESECTEDDEDDECEYTDGDEDDVDDDADYWAIV
ncbi:hypothetical protein KC315_g7135 [Hortaea werneckii]|nr:hypothetical protein KC315_g7135 [Hortaea werneckii]